jgi:hypothetical protein
VASQAEVARQARERYRAAHELRQGGATWEQVARKLGWSKGRRQACEQVSKYIARHGPPPWPDIPDPEPKPPKPKPAPKPKPKPRAGPGTGDVVTVEFKGKRVSGPVIRVRDGRLVVRLMDQLVRVPPERVVECVAGR